MNKLLLTTLASFTITLISCTTTKPLNDNNFDKNKQVEINDPETQWKLAQDFLNKDNKKAFYWTLKAGENGVLDAMVKLPNMYRYGIGTEKNYDRAFYWQKKLVDTLIKKYDTPSFSESSANCFNLKDYQLELSAMYYCGMGVKPNLTEANKWKQKMIQGGGKDDPKIYAVTCEEIGKYNLAIPLYKQAVKDDDGFAQINLAIMYEKGQGVEKNYQKAMELLQQASENGYIRAINNIGDMYENGYGVPVDYAKAKEYYLQAVAYDESSGYFSMGQLYKLGRGVKKDLKKATEWYQQACNKGLNLGCEEVEKLEQVE